MGVIGGAIEGIHTPLQSGSLPVATAPLFRQHPHVRGVTLQHGQYSLLRRHIGLGHQIAGTPLFPNALQLTEVLTQLCGTRFSGTAGHFGQMLKLAGGQTARRQGGLG